MCRNRAGQEIAGLPIRLVTVLAVDGVLLRGCQHAAGHVLALAVDLFAVRKHRILAIVPGNALIALDGRLSSWRPDCSGAGTIPNHAGAHRIVARPSAAPEMKQAA